MKDFIHHSKTYLNAVLIGAVLLLSSCSANPATGRSQFSSLMSPAQETQVGAQEHEKIVAQFGLYEDEKLQNYVQSVGARVAQDTERPDVQYKFFVLDSPIVNAFALPGGYIYVSRGLLALANSEAELASVLGHEIGHVTGRHTAERYSHSVVTSLGTGILSAVLDSSLASQALGVGGNLYLTSYSRSQENEADTLGMRYMARAGYDTRAVPEFLESLKQKTALDSKTRDEKEQGFSYFSTHPATGERVEKTITETAQYPAGGKWEKDKYLAAIDDMVYSDSAAQGFVRGRNFYHTGIGFTFQAPEGFEIINQPSQVIALSKDKKSVMIFDMKSNAAAHDPETYLRHIWMKDQNVGTVSNTTISGMKAASASFSGNINNSPADIYIYAIQWAPQTYARFQIGVPKGAADAYAQTMTSYVQSLRRLTAEEREAFRPDIVHVMTALAGDTVSSLARRQSFETLEEEHFRVLNGMNAGEQIVPGNQYKMVISP